MYNNSVTLVCSSLEASRQLSFYRLLLSIQGDIGMSLEVRGPEQRLRFWHEYGFWPPHGADHERVSFMKQVWWDAGSKPKDVFRAIRGLRYVRTRLFFPQAGMYKYCTYRVLAMGSHKSEKGILSAPITNGIWVVDNSGAVLELFTGMVMVI